MQNKTKKILHHLIPILLVTVLSFIYIKVAFAAEPSVGAVNNWFSLTGATYLSVDMTANRGEGGYHFYSLSPFFQGKNYGLYSGLQTNGNLGDGVDVGNVYIFSVWNATAAYPENGATATPFGGEGVGYSLRAPYNWSIGRKYTVTLQRQSFDSGLNGWRWSSTIRDSQTGVSTKIGEILAPAEANQLSGGSAFHERYVGNTPACMQSSSNLEAASATFANLVSDKPASFYGTPARNNVFNSSSCSAYIHTYSDASRAVTGFGMNQTDFDSLFQASATPGSATTPGTNNGSGSSSTPSSQSSQGGTPTKTQEKYKDNPTTESSKSQRIGIADGGVANAGVVFSEKEQTEAKASSVSKSKTGLAVGGAVGILSLGLGVFVLLKFHILKI